MTNPSPPSAADASIAEMKRVAEAATHSGSLKAEALFDATFDPPTVLALLAEIDRLRKVERAAKVVLKGLNARIGNACGISTPIFDGIAALHDALLAGAQHD